MKLNELTQEQRNALCAFGQADQDATIANLMIAGAAAVKPEAAKVLMELADRLYRLPMSDTEYQTLFYTVKYRKEQAMTSLMLDCQCVSGNMETTHPWKPYAKRPIPYPPLLTGSSRCWNSLQPISQKHSRCRSRGSPIRENRIKTTLWCARSYMAR